MTRSHKENPDARHGDARSARRLSRTGLTAVLALGFMALLATAALWLYWPRTPPNVLVISLCSIRADHMSLYGYPRRTTPNWDALAAESVVFEHAVTPWPKTAPAFASLMTGKYGHTTGVMRVTPWQYLDDEHETLAEVLRAKGYDTGAFISTPAVTRSSNILQGFETIVETFRFPHPFAETTEQAFAWLAGPREKPFLAWVHYNNAHWPYGGGGAPPDMFVDDAHYDPSRKVAVNPDPSLPLDVPKEHPFRRQILRADIGGAHRDVVLDERPNESDFYVARYDAGIYAADRMAGDLLQKARDAGLLENTIVVVVGDHGESLGDHNYYFEHGRFPYDDSARVPLLIRPAHGSPPIRVSRPVPTLGLVPTLLEMLDLEPPEGVEAESFWGTVDASDGPEYVFSESGYQFDYTLSVRDDTWKLIHVPNPLDRALMTGSEYELYDLTRDPRELKNSFLEEPTVAHRLRRVLHDWASPWVQDAYSAAERPKPHLDEQTLDRLRSLGYVE